MAALLQKELRSEFQVESAGTWEETVGRPANEHSIFLMQERGIDLTGHESRWIGDLDLTQFSHIVCVGESEARMINHYLAEYGGTAVLIANNDQGGIPDPYGMGLPVYQICVDLLGKAVLEIADLIRR